MLLEHGADPNRCAAFNVLTPLAWAASNGNIEMVDLLLRYGADPARYERKEKTSPLIKASESQQGDAARYLLSINTDVDFTDQSGRTVLSYAALTRNFELLRLLVEKRADVNHMDHRKNTILEIAIGDDFFSNTPVDSAMVHYLVDHGAFITERAFNLLCLKAETTLAKYLIEKGLQIGPELIMYAVLSGDLGFVKYVESSVNLSLDYESPDLHRTTMSVAIKSHKFPGHPDGKINLDLVRYVLSKETNWNRYTIFESLLTKEENDTTTAACAEMLIDAGAVVNNIPDSKLDYTPLMWAAACRMPLTAAVFIRHGGAINHRNKSGRTALMLACWKYKNEALITMLINNGAEINAVDEKGYTAAMNAAVFGLWDNIRLLAVSGADLNTRSVFGTTLLDLVWDQNLKKYLISLGAKKGNEFD